MLTRNMFFLFLFVCSIQSVISLSNQEDLSLTNYSQIGCLKFQSDKQFLWTNIQENSLSSYQTFSSPFMTIELCFRLCRRWFILLFNNQTNCICLYTIDQSYELNQYLGDFLSTNNCSSTDVQIYSLTNEISIFRPLLTSTNDDWSFDGCYYLQGLQHARVSLSLNQVDFIQAIDLCRKHCQTFENENVYSFFLSRKKSCYCLPLNLSETIKTIALRKPLIHCSFHPYICQGFSNSCEKYYNDTTPDTLIKINVRHYCSSTVFDQIFYRCFNSIILQNQTNLMTINSNEKCLPLVIKTIEQWKYFIQSSWITYSKLFISIDRNSTYIFNDLFRTKNFLRSIDNFCLVIYRTKSNEISSDLISCQEVRSPGSVLCAQKPLQSNISHEKEFRMINNQSEIFSNEILSCPLGFVLFNNMCYYIHLSFIYNARAGESLCLKQNSNSTLVKFDTHEWGNINATKFLGRTYTDLLLEFFYYLLEKQLLAQTIEESERKNWLRLLVGDKNDPNECFLRYFARATGAFTVFPRCNIGGHPVCQYEPIRTKIISTRTSSSITSKRIESTIPTISFRSSTRLTTTVSTRENSTINTLDDDNSFTNETIDDFTNDTLTVNTQTKNKYLRYRPLFVIMTGPGLALIILIIGIALLVRHLRRNHGSYSARSSILDYRRGKRSSTTITMGDIPNTPVVLPSYSKIPRVSFNENDMLLPLDNSVPSNGEAIELLPATKVHRLNAENRINENDEEIVDGTVH